MPGDVREVRQEICARASQNFTVAQVRALISAAESSSFSQAAQRLRLSQPALSQCIKVMEDALGVELFVRSNRGVRLSTAGEAILPHAKRLVEAYEGTLAFLSARKAVRRGMLRLAADASVAPVIAAELQDNLQRELAGARLQVGVMGSEEAVCEVLSRRAELGLCGEMEGHPALRYTPLLEAQLGLILPPDCVIPKSIGSLRDLDATPFIRLADCTPVTRSLKRHNVDFPAYFDSPVVFTCLSAAFDLMREQKLPVVATGIGASLPQARGMEFLPLPGLLPALTVYLVSLRKLVEDTFSERLRDVVKNSVHRSDWHPSIRRLNLQKTVD